MCQDEKWNKKFRRLMKVPPMVSYPIVSGTMPRPGGRASQQLDPVWRVKELKTMY